MFDVGGDSVVAAEAGRKSLEPGAGVGRILVSPEFDQVVKGGGVEITGLKGGYPGRGFGRIELCPVLDDGDDGVFQEATGS